MATAARAIAHRGFAAFVLPPAGVLVFDALGTPVLGGPLKPAIAGSRSGTASDRSAFDEAYKTTDGFPLIDAPAFEVANRINAGGIYLKMERVLLAR
jgi:hypothetical protein